MHAAQRLSHIVDTNGIFVFELVQQHCDEDACTGTELFPQAFCQHTSAGNCLRNNPNVTVLADDLLELPATLLSCQLNPLRFV